MSNNNVQLYTIYTMLNNEAINSKSNDNNKNK